MSFLIVYSTGAFPGDTLYPIISKNWYTRQCNICACDVWHSVRQYPVCLDHTSQPGRTFGDSVAKWLSESVVLIQRLDKVAHILFMCISFLSGSERRQVCGQSFQKHWLRKKLSILVLTRLLLHDLLCNCCLAS